MQNKSGISEMYAQHKYHAYKRMGKSCDEKSQGDPGFVDLVQNPDHMRWLLLANCRVAREIE